MLVETFPHEGTHYMVAFPFEGWNAHQSLGMLLTRRMETAGYGPLGFIATDYALGAWSVKPVIDPRPLRSEEHTSALQSLMRISYAVFCLNKKKPHISTTNTLTTKYDTITH